MCVCVCVCVPINVCWINVLLHTHTQGLYGACVCSDRDYEVRAVSLILWLLVGQLGKQPQEVEQTSAHTLQEMTSQLNTASERYIRFHSEK